MRIGIIGPKESKDSLSLKHAFEEKGHECKRLNILDFYFDLENNAFHAHHRKYDLNDFDVFIFRSIKKYYSEGALLAKYLVSLNKYVIDESLVQGLRCMMLGDKYILAKEGIPQLDSTFTNSRKAARDVLMEMDHPILISPVNNKTTVQSQISEDWTESYDITRTHKDSIFLFTKLVDVASYNRIFVIGDKVVGGMTRKIVDTEKKMHFSKSYKSSKLLVEQEQADLALKAAQSLQYTVAAVDMVTIDNRHFVLQVLRAPKFAKFEQISGVDYKSELVSFIEGMVK